jgi:hypothetical protein
VASAAPAVSTLSIEGRPAQVDFMMQRGEMR